MCVVALAWKAHPRWRLVLAGNRDEFHARPSAPLGDNDGRIGGRDLRSGGMWLGVSEAGRCAVVTNVAGQGDPDPAKRSRGALVANALDGRTDAVDLDGFNPFSLIVIDDKIARLLTNRPAPDTLILEPGLHALSNGVAGAHWPRGDSLGAALRSWLDGPASDPADLFAALADEDGVPPAFIRDPVYGTRCSTVVAIGLDGAGTIVERSFGPDGKRGDDVSIAFRWPD